MRLYTRGFPTIALAFALAGCSLGSLFGGELPLRQRSQTLTPDAPDPGAITRSSAAAQAVTIAVPVTTRELKTVRVPVILSPTNVQYVTNLQWIDTPERLFQNLVAETVRRTTNRVVIDPGQTGLDPGIILRGELQRFGYDAQTGQVVVVFDGSLALSPSATVLARRFTATAPSDGTGPSVGPALNRAANQVALQIANWIGAQHG